jgi:hypothetical protein
VTPAGAAVGRIPLEGVAGDPEFADWAPVP